MTNFARSIAVFSGVAACSLTTPLLAQSRTDTYLCEQTTHLIYDDGSGVLQPGTISSSFVLQSTLTSAPTSRRGYQYYKAHSDMGATQAQNNPYFVDSGLSGEIVGLSHIAINPVADAPPGVTDAGLYAGDIYHPDLWDGMRFRVDFLNDALEVTQSYIASGRITLMGSSSGTALLPSVTNTYWFSTNEEGPGRPLIVLPGSFGTPAALYLQDVTFTTTLVPAPGALALLGVGGLIATRRRR